MGKVAMAWSCYRIVVVEPDEEGVASVVLEQQKHDSMGQSSWRECSPSDAMHSLMGWLLTGKEVSRG